MRVVVALLVVAAVVVFACDWPSLDAQMDDAFIAYRYSRNLVEGNGFTYNIGDRVEGFTSLSWVFLVAAGILAGFDAPAVSRVLGVLFGGATLVASFLYANSALSPRHRLLAALPPWLLVASTSFAYWATSGLETPLFVSCVIVALLLDMRGRSAAAVAIAAVATLTRPEGSVLAAVLLAFSLRRTGWKQLHSWALPALYTLFLLGLTAFRLAYFGAPLPNTFYAKVGGMPTGYTLRYEASFFVQIFAPVAIPFVVGVARDDKLRPGAVWTLAVVGYVAAVGADLADHSRFFLPTLPFIFAIAIRGVADCLDCRTLWQRIVVACIPVAFVWYVWGPLAGAFVWLTVAALAVCVGGATTTVSWLGVVTIGALVSSLGATARWREQPDYPRWMRNPLVPSVVYTRAGELMRLRKTNELWARGSRSTNAQLDKRRSPVLTVAALGIGVLGYESRRRVIDILGLTDRVIARTRIPEKLAKVTVPLPGHLRANADRVLSLRPDCIIVPQKPTGIWMSAHIEILLHPDLRRFYDWDPHVDGFCLR